MTKSSAIDTHEITDATAWRCLALSERTSCVAFLEVGVDAPGDPAAPPS